MDSYEADNEEPQRKDAKEREREQKRRPKKKKVEKKKSQSKTKAVAKRKLMTIYEIVSDDEFKEVQERRVYVKDKVSEKILRRRNTIAVEIKHERPATPPNSVSNTPTSLDRERISPTHEDESAENHKSSAPEDDDNDSENYEIPDENLTFNDDIGVNRNTTSVSPPPSRIQPPLQKRKNDFEEEQMRQAIANSLMHVSTPNQSSHEKGNQHDFDEEQTRQAIQNSLNDRAQNRNDVNYDSDDYDDDYYDQHIEILRRRNERIAAEKQRRAGTAQVAQQVQSKCLSN